MPTFQIACGTLGPCKYCGTLRWPNERHNRQDCDQILRHRRRKKIGARQRKRILERDSARCRQCGETEVLEMDHLIPIAQGGTNADANLQVLCPPCNKRKGAFFPWPLLLEGGVVSHVYAR